VTAPPETHNRQRPKPARKRTRLSSVANAMRLLRAFSDDEFEIGVSDLAKRLGLAKSTVHRLASTLIQERILERSARDGKYRLGLVLFELGSLVRRKMDVAHEARPQLRGLMEATGETVQLAILDHLSVLYINKMESVKAVRMSSSVGSRAPVHCTSVGKVLLAYRPPEMVGRVIEAGLKAYTASSITSPEALQAELAAVRNRGYAIDDEEIEVGLRCVAAPIRNHSGEVVAAISVAAPVQRMSKRTMQTCVPTVIAAAEAVSRRLGFLPSLGARRLDD